jgi:hypothetical protein
VWPDPFVGYIAAVLDGSEQASDPHSVVSVSMYSALNRVITLHQSIVAGPANDAADRHTFSAGSLAHQPRASVGVVHANPPSDADAT